MTGDDTTRLADRERARQRRMNWIVWALVPTAILALAGAAVSTVIAEGKSAQVDGLSKALTAQCQQTKRLGHNCVAAPAPSVRANPAQPTVSPQPAATGPQGPGPTSEQVLAAVVAAIQAHPEWLHVQPDPATLLADVDNWLADHAPKAIAPTAQQIYDAVLAVYTQHPPAAGSTGPSGPAGPQGSTGPQGEKGDKGDPPSAADIAAAVESWFEQHPLPTCPDGTTAQAHTWLTLDAGTISAVVCEKTSGS